MANFASRARLTALFLYFLSIACVGLPTHAPAQGAASTLAGPAKLQANRVVDSANSTQVVQITGHRPPWASAANDAGPIADATRVDLIFGVARAPEVEAAFRQLLDDQQNPSSSRFHQWLTPQQIGEQFGPTQHDLDALTAWLAGQGITVDAVLPSRVNIQAHATAAVIGNAFHTSLHTYALKAGNLQAPTSEPSLPASLSPMVSYIGGLASVPYHTHSVLADAATQAAYAASTATNGPRANYTTSTGYHALTPNDFATIYDLNPAYAAGIKGTGYKIAIIGGSRLGVSDVANYETLANLPSYTPNAIVPAGFTDPGLPTTQTGVGNQLEGMLDFERAYGTAPGAQIDFFLDQNWLNGTNTQNLLLYAINTLNDPIISLSIGACEAVQSPSYIKTEDSTFAQAAAQGISVFVSSGDQGAYGCDGLTGLTTAQAQTISISDYCASTSVTCVGGTEFADLASPSSYWAASNSTGGSSALSYIPEGGWNDPVNSNGVYQAASSGGGVSTVIAKPSWQTGAGVPADGFRDAPDISFSGSVHNAYIVCQSATTGAGCVPSNFGALLVGGTSASAPSMAGVAALIDQKLGGRQGNMSPLLYKLHASAPAAFHDATPASSGVASCALGTPTTCNNSVPAGTTAITPSLPGYALTTGYDQVTGLGSLDVNNFLSAAGLPTPIGTLTASPATITISQTTKFTATFVAPSGTTGTPTGTVQFYSNGVAIGSAVTLSNGSATSAAFSFSPAATYSITAVYSGDTVFGPSTSASLSLIVTNPAAIASTSIITVSPGTAVASNAPVTINVTVTGSGATPTGTVTIFDTGISKATLTLTNGTAAYSAGLLAAGTHAFTCKYSGDVTYSSSSCPSVTVTSTALATATAITLTPLTVPSGTSPTLAFTVTSPSGGTPTGSVTAYVVGQGAIGSVGLTNGTVSASLTGFGPGTYGIYGIYSGDSTYAGSQSPTVTFTVTGFGMTSAPGTLSLADGATSGNTVTVGYTSVGGFTGAITQTCSIVLNSGTPTLSPTCASNPASITLAANGTATSTVTVFSAAAVAMNGSSHTVNDLSGRAIGGVALAGLLMLVLPGRRRILGNWRLLSILLFLSAALLTASGCSSGGGAPSGGTPGTTKGTYTLTITGTSGAITNTTTTTVTLN